MPRAKAAPGTEPAPRQLWAPADIDYLRTHYASALTCDLAQHLGRSAVRVAAKAYALGLKKSREVIAATSKERVLRLGHGGQLHQFKPGQVPWNKGTKGLVGTQEGCRATQFKASHKPSTWVPVGSFRVTSGGVLERKFGDNPGPPTARWRSYATQVWEFENGPVPKGFIVVFQPGKKTTEPALVTLDRLECISRAENIRRNSIHNLPPKLLEVTRLRGALTRTINTKAKEAEAT